MSFNDIMLFGRTAVTCLDHIKYLKESSVNSKRDFILKMVVDTFKTTNWKEFYGLSIKETMQLEFADYSFMVDELKKHTEDINQKTEAAKAGLEELNK